MMMCATVNGLTGANARQSCARRAAAGRGEGAVTVVRQVRHRQHAGAGPAVAAAAVVAEASKAVGGLVALMQ